MSDGVQTGPPLLPLGADPGLDLSGRTLGEYLILRRLGQGGMGQVYLAEQVSLKRRVALKILRPDLAANPTSLQRFKNEAEAVARATHANIVQVYAIGQADGLTFMALEYVEGRNLQEFVARKGPPDLLLALTIMRQVAAALQRAAELGIIHRDVKPENILLTRKGEVKVADFGLSRCLAGDQPPTNLTQSGVTMGTPLYMSPEQVEGKTLDPRTDIYSFGVTCYYMLAGQPPFRGESAFEVALQHVRAEPEPLARLRPDLPEALCVLVHKMMAKDPAARQQTCRELLKDIARVREGLSVQAGAAAPAFTATVPPATPTMVPGLPVPETARPTQAVPTQPLRRRRRLVPILFVLSLLLAAGGGVLYAVWQRHRAEAAAPAAVVPAETDPAPHDLPQKREQALREAAEQYLSGPANTPLTSVDTGYNLCRDLAVLYLEEDRLDEAEKLFVRLEGIRQHPFYRTLGHLGRGIVLALRNPQQPKESNKSFHDVFDGPFPLRGGGAPGRRVHPLLRGKLRYWILKAVHYNVANGLPVSEIPRALRTLLDNGRS